MQILQIQQMQIRIFINFKLTQTQYIQYNRSDMNMDEDFKKKREQFSITLRKNNREEILMKRRNIAANKQQENKVQHLIIVDQSLRTFLVQALNLNFTHTQIQQLLELLKSQNIYDKHKAIIGIRKLSLQPEEQTMNYLIRENIIADLVRLCDQQAYLQIKLQAMWVLTNLSSFSKEASKLQVQCKLMPIACKSLLHENQYIKYQSIWIVGNLAADHYLYRDQLISLGAVQSIISFLSANRTDKEMVTIAWTLSNLARGNPPPKYDEVKSVVPIITQILKTKVITNEDIIADCLWTLANLSDGPKMRLQRLMQTKPLAVVMEHLRSRNITLKIPAIRIVGNFTTGNKQQTNEVINNNFFDAALELLSHEKWVLVKQTCWALSNITAGTDQQILRFLQRQDLIQKLLALYPSQIGQVKIEVVWIFTNMERSGTPNMILKLFLAIKLLPMIGQLFEESSRIIIDSLVCLYRILLLGDRAKQEDENNVMVQQFYASGLASKLQSLQNHKSIEVHNQCIKIMKRFFSLEEVMNDA